MRKKIFDLIFILFSASLLILLAEFKLLEKYVAFAFLPIMMAYFLGQYSERTFNK